MKRKIHMELLATAVFAILLTLLCALFVFYGVYRKQVIGDLKADALVMKNMHIFDNISDLHPDAYDLNPDTLRITVVNANGSVIFDSNADFSVMENHEDRPEIHMAAKVGEGSGTRRSTTLDRNLFYYAIRIDNGRILRIAREGDNIFALTQNMMMTVVGVFVLLFFFCIMMANYFTKNLVAPIEQMAENLSEPGTQAAYKELVPFMNKIRQQHEDILKSSQVRQEFTANVSHELKTPIALIQGYAEGLTEGMAEDEDSRNYYCEVIMDEAGKMNKMVKQLLTLTALEFGNDMPVMERFDITALIRGILASAGILLQQKEARVVFEQKEPVWVWADEFKIEEVITNYLNNAMNHLEGERRIEIRLERKEKEVRITVFNTGRHIPEEDLGNLWTKFYKVDKARTREYGGSGIGLSIVKAIMDSHNKSCGVENVDGGVEFWFTVDSGI